AEKAVPLQNGFVSPTLPGETAYVQQCKDQAAWPNPFVYRLPNAPPSLPALFVCPNAGDEGKPCKAFKKPWRGCRWRWCVAWRRVRATTWRRVCMRSRSTTALLRSVAMAHGWNVPERKNWNAVWGTSAKNNQPRTFG